MIDNIHEEIAYWQQYDEDRILEIIDEQELAAVSEVDAAECFNKEVNRRKASDQLK